MKKIIAVLAVVFSLVIIGNLLPEEKETKDSGKETAQVQTQISDATQLEIKNEESVDEVVKEEVSIKQEEDHAEEPIQQENKSEEVEKPVTQQTTNPTISNNNNAADNTQTNNTPSVTVPKQEDTTGDLVWIPTHGGTKYHNRSGCSNMKNPQQVTRDRAEANGFTPCKKCY